jgi:hypothetical protein
MLIFDDLGIGGLQCRIAHQPAGSMLEVSCRQPLDAAAHGGQPEIGAVGDQGGEQRAVGIRAARFISGKRPKGTGDATAPVDIQQDIFETDPGHAALDQPAQGPQFGGHGECIGTSQTQLTLIDAGKTVGCQPIGAAGWSVRPRLLQKGDQAIWCQMRDITNPVTVKGVTGIMTEACAVVR